VETIDRGGHAHTRAAGEYRVSYRQVIGARAEEWFIAASLSFEHRPPRTRARCARCSSGARRRSRSASGAAVRCSPTRREITPRASIEVAGLKGFRVGDASVSHKHANFIINHGQASAADLERLIAHVPTRRARAWRRAAPLRCGIVGAP